MPTKSVIFLYSLQCAPLETINEIKFTPREIDIIACLVSGRGRKTTASLLSIAEKTVETHTRNIMVKLECGSQEEIRDRIEKSDKLTAVKHHYLTLLNEAYFKHFLQKIQSLVKQEKPTCLLIYWKDLEADKDFVIYLEKDLNLAGIKIIPQAREAYRSSNELVEKVYAQQIQHILYLSPDIVQEAAQIKEIMIDEDVSLLAQAASKTSSEVFFLVQDKDSSEKSHFSTTNVEILENYYFLIFEILKKVFPHVNLEPIINEFSKQYQATCGGNERFFSHVETDITPFLQEGVLYNDLLFQNNKKSPSAILKEKQNPALKNSTWNKYFSFKHIVSQKNWIMKGGAFCLATFIIFFFIYKLSPFGENKRGYDPSSIRSDLALPIESVFLDRPGLTNEIGNKLKGEDGIRTIVLMGIGGAGKTTLARQYAHQQNIPTIWEINAENLTSLRESFENLAQTLAKTEEDKKNLKELQEIKNATKKEEKILQFVKEHLKLQEDWLLIYDNVRSFQDIQSYFPKDSHTWGQGKIILTTRDSNIQNNKYINEAIQVGTLDESQKLTLFAKIMSNGKAQALPPAQEAKAKKFLAEIPSFPLDVSLAAYYIKATNVPYDTYLKDLNQYDKDFVNVQENLLKESGEYNATRYSIIILSLEQLIKTHQDFEALLLLISLLDSQDIPRDLLSTSKSDSIVDSFIYNLEKYSFIANHLPAHTSMATLSFHRSVPQVILDYLTKSLISEKRNKLLQEISNSLANYITHVIENENVLKMRLLARHGRVFLTHDNLLTDGMKQALETALGHVYFYLGDYRQAGELLTKGLPFLRKSSTQNPLKLAKALDTLGVIYRELGDYQEAKKVLDECLAIYEKNSPQNYKETAHTLTHLGSIYKELGDESEARSLLERSLPLYDKCPPKNNKENIWTLVHLGIVHKDLGNYEKAINFLEQSLSIYKAHFPENYVRRAFVLAKLGNLYNLAGNYTKANECLEQSLALYKKHFSENDVGFAYASSILGKTYQALGKYKEARELLQKSLTAYEANYGKDHIEVARVLRNLGKIYLLEGQLGTGENLLKQASEIFLKYNHPEGKAVLAEIASTQNKK